MASIQVPGRYLGKAESAEITKSKNKGTPGALLLLRNDAGDHIYHTLWLSDGALENSVNTLKEVFGFDGNFETINDQVKGKECSFTVEMEEYEGKEYPRVKWLNTPRASQPVEDSMLTALSRKARAIVGTPQQAKAPVDSDNVPF